MFTSTLRRFGRDESGNFTATLALVLIPIIGLIGAGVDFTTSAKRKATLDAIADSASLAGVTPSLVSQADQASVNAATTQFNAQSTGLAGISNIALTVTPQDNGLYRSVTVTYTARSETMFGGFIGMSTIGLSGASTATASIPPNIDFYLLLDNSPSMAIAATATGIDTMVANTPDQCAFACHASDTSPNDYYGLARRLGVTLRMDLVTQATQSLMSTAQTTMSGNNAKYRAAIYTFNIGFNTITSLTSNLDIAQSLAAKIQLYEVPYQNWNSDTITNYTTAMGQINSIMPNPGNGTNIAGDRPQEVLFFVTDGVEDVTSSTARVQSLMDPSYCTTIKNRGIRIAVLYTTYLPLPTNAWYNQYIAPFEPNIGPTLESCASPGLFFQVSTDQDISAALIALFNTAVSTAHLTK